MHIRLAVYGKARNKFVAEECECYIRRLKGQVSFDVVELRESAQREPTLKLAEEFALFEKKIGFDSPVCLMSEEGRVQSTVEMAEWLQKAFESYRTLTFVIGSAWGLSDEFRKKAQWVLSLSPLTFTHDHARVLLVEQLYRCVMVNQGHPYHHV